jgi:hypothetical protein
LTLSRIFYFAYLTVIFDEVIRGSRTVKDATTRIIRVVSDFIPLILIRTNSTRRVITREAGNYERVAAWDYKAVSRFCDLVSRDFVPVGEVQVPCTCLSKVPAIKIAIGSGVGAAGYARGK